MAANLNENKDSVDQNGLSFDGQVVWTTNPLFASRGDDAGLANKGCIANHYLSGSYDVRQSEECDSSLKGVELDSSVKSADTETESGYCETVSLFSGLSSPEPSAVCFSDEEDDYDDLTDKVHQVTISPAPMNQIDANSNIVSAQILSSKGTVRGVKNRVRDNILQFFSGAKDAAPGKQMKKDVVPTAEDPDHGKVLIYTTSLGLVRKTQYECRYVKQMFHNLMVRFDERDLFVHPHYKMELETRLGKEVHALPQIFINGQSIGGAKDVEKMIETGVMKDFLVDVKRVSHAQSCQVCGGYKFISCNKCSGSGKSRRTRISREINSLKCSACCSGLVSCPECNT